jgi:hemoglobin/transferrin/lactoferrin receptor protein
MAHLALLAFGILAQDPQPEEPKRIVITANPVRPTDAFLNPYHTTVLDDDRLHDRQAARSFPDALKEAPGVHVQKTGPGQASPFIRGFTGYRTLAMIDTIRLNNSTFRSGPNQYWSTVDMFLVDRIEVARGPGSILYGSDAMGGVAAVYTRSRESFEPGFHAGARAHLRFAGAEDSVVSRLEFEGNVDDFGWLVGGTSKQFGDIDAGRHQGLLPNTGWHEFDGDARFTLRLDAASRIDIAYQRARQFDSPRTHRTLASKSYRGTALPAPGDRGSLQEEFDQERDLAYAAWTAEKLGGVIDSARVVLSGQRQFEERFRVRASDGDIDVDSFAVNTAGLVVQLGSSTSFGYVTYGVDMYHDEVRSDRFRIDLPSSTVSQFGRGPVADDARYRLFGAFLQDELDLSPSDVLTLGIRYTRAEARARGVAQGPAFDAALFATLPPLDETYGAVVGGARLLHRFSEEWVGIVGVSQSFRAPSLNDSTSIETVSGTPGPGLQIPATGLDPERTLQAEVGARYRSKTLSIEAFYFHTFIQDFLGRVSIPDVNGDGNPDFQLQNFSDGYVKGFEAGAAWQATPDWELYASFAWALGNVDTLVGGVTVERPMDKMNPATALLGARWQEAGSPLWVEGWVTIVWEQSRLSPGDKADAQRIPPGGTPGYTLFGLRGGGKLCESASLTVAIENIGNRDYRPHGSGQNEPGTNVVVGLDVRY